MHVFMHEMRTIIIFQSLIAARVNRGWASAIGFGITAVLCFKQAVTYFRNILVIGQDYLYCSGSYMGEIPSRACQV